MRIHVVQKGDTMWKIAKKYGVDFKELLRLNSQISTPDVIYPGARIKIPSKRVPIRPRDTESTEEGQSPFVKEMPMEESRETPIVPPEIERRPMETPELGAETEEGNEVEIERQSPEVSELPTPPALPPQQQTPPAQPPITTQPQPFAPMPPNAMFPPMPQAQPRQMMPQIQQQPTAPQPFAPMPPNAMFPPMPQGQPRQMMPQFQQQPTAPQPFAPMPPNAMFPPMQSPMQSPMRHHPCGPCGEAPRMMPMPYAVPLCPPLPDVPVPLPRPLQMPSQEPSSMCASAWESTYQQYAVPPAQSSSADMYSPYAHGSPYRSYQSGPMFRPHAYMNSPMYPSSQHMTTMPSGDVMPNWEKGHDESSSSQ